LQNDQIDEIVNRLEGFSKIVKLMKKYKKPLVGHNMLNDILLMYQMFIAELPGFVNKIMLYKYMIKMYLIMQKVTLTLRRIFMKYSPKFMILNV
jgi:hypothetical protein